MGIVKISDLMHENLRIASHAMPCHEPLHQFASGTLA